MSSTPTAPPIAVRVRVARRASHEWHTAMENSTAAGPLSLCPNGSPSNVAPGKRFSIPPACSLFPTRKPDGCRRALKSSAASALSASFSTRTLPNASPRCASRPQSAQSLEPRSGALMARRAVQLLLEELMADGMEYRQQSILPPSDGHRIQASTGETIEAENFVFACGPWLPKLFPALLSSYITPVRAEIFLPRRSRRDGRVRASWDADRTLHGR